MPSPGPEVFGRRVQCRLDTTERNELGRPSDIVDWAAAWIGVQCAAWNKHLVESHRILDKHPVRCGYRDKPDITGPLSVLRTGGFC